MQEGHRECVTAWAQRRQSGDWRSRGATARIARVLEF